MKFLRLIAVCLLASCASLLQVSDDGRVVTYKGAVGETALERLREIAEVKTSASALGEYVIGINGISGTGAEFWAFYVNGEMSKIGAGNYVAKASDEFEWRLRLRQ